jgi:hypothetical protein
MTQITYFKPYSQEWDFQWFDTYTEAIRMVAFYKSCGSNAYIVE